ncbi:MAG: DUF1573 domain-containing protein [Lentimicrobiaceae bacterium]|nr:DUF1573 domain-containing protein [Lentimicrobiaceae bacterium]
MKKFILTSLIILFVVSYSFAQEVRPGVGTSAQVENVNLPIAEYNTLTYDYGNIEQGTPKEATFVLTNKGREPLIITSARASCGCTNLKYSREPILSGKETVISVTYNAAAMGNFLKTVTVTTNADDKPVVLKIKGQVVAKKE